MSQDGFILYCVVAKGNKVLAEFTNPLVKYGNFQRVSLKILEKIPPLNSKMIYSYDSYNFSYEVSNEVTFMCMSDSYFSTAQCFKFIQNIKEEWFKMYGDSGKTVSNNYAMNKSFKPFLKNKMNYFNHDPESNKIRKIKNQIQDIQNVMITNIDKVIQRGERIDILVGKTDELVVRAEEFKKKTNDLKRAIISSWLKAAAVCGFIIIVLALILFLYFCNGVGCLSE
ncbi:hypothetical protein C9374_008608 [Naegleria lovaniensis]|uniref:Uncharacterized protein n=1 Tax=Naegleria lovaniensis TaxID=51637 RepID=A0AA88GIT1_NAELO|nr:uncharacterized protein C9374_008608 [Naegleria lovaniensis]KAG2377986.1 hypothetical protein C9374_008608 [Naegleria lovaniensis]